MPLLVPIFAYGGALLLGYNIKGVKDGVNNTLTNFVLMAAVIAAGYFFFIRR